MNYEQLKVDILADPALATLAGDAGQNNDYPQSQDGTIADILNTANVQAHVQTLISARSMLSLLPPTEAATILDKLEAASAQIPALRWAMKFMVGELGIDIGHANARAMLDQLQAAGVLLETEVTALKNLSAVTISRAKRDYGRDVSNLDVARALGRPGPGW